MSKGINFEYTPQLVQLIMGRDYSKQHKNLKLFIMFSDQYFCNISLLGEETRLFWNIIDWILVLF